MSYMIFEIQEGNLVITDPRKSLKGIARARGNTQKKWTDPMMNTTDEDYTDHIADMGDDWSGETPILDELEDSFGDIW